MQQYKFSVRYNPGKENPADYMSRHPLETYSNHTQRLEESTEEYVNFIAINAVSKAITMEQLEEETRHDVTIQKAIEAKRHSNWHIIIESTTDDPRISTAELKALHLCEQELTVNADESLLLHGTQLVLPASLRQRAIEIAHEGHQGMVKTKKLLREKVWFPGINRMVENLLKSCIPCQATVQTSPKSQEPLQMTKLPSGPWQEISVDFCGPFPAGFYLLVMICEFSRFPEVVIVYSTAAEVVVPRMDQVFSTLGIPSIVKTDNGPPFNGAEFAKFAEELGFHHRKITPLHPQANSESERFMRTLKNAVQACHIEKKNIKHELYRFLRNYKATPHSTTELSPFEIMFNRKMKTKLPQVVEKVRHPSLRRRDKQAKRKMKIHADTRKKATPSTLKVGDFVLVRQKKQNKLTPPYDPKPLQITKKKGSMITAERDGWRVTRNSSHFKQTLVGPAVNDDMDDDEIEGNVRETQGEREPEPEGEERSYPIRERNPPKFYGSNA